MNASRHIVVAPQLRTESSPEVLSFGGCCKESVDIATACQLLAVAVIQQSWNGDDRVDTNTEETHDVRE